MPYSPQTWVNDDPATPLSADRLTHIEDGLVAALAAEQAGAPSGVATLDSSGKVPTGQLPALAITNTHPVASEAAMLALNAQTGDIAVRTDLSRTFILAAEPAATLGNWLELATPAGQVTSVDGQTGVVDLSGDYEPLGAVAAHTADGTAVHGIADTSALVVTTDPRLADARTPTGHAASHGSGGSDPVTPAAIGAATTGHNHTAATHNTQTTSYTLALTDAGKVVELDNASANTLTVPPNSSVAFPTGSYLVIRQYGAGKTTVTAGAGVTIRSRGGLLALAGQYAEATLTKRGTDEWVLSGDIAA